MGSPPPQDAPPPDEQSYVSGHASFEPSPTGGSLCGFKIPGFSFGLGLRVPSMPEFPPKFNFAIALNCDVSDPIDTKFSFGGGRVSTSDPDPDDAW